MRTVFGSALVFLLFLSACSIGGSKVSIYTFPDHKGSFSYELKDSDTVIMQTTAIWTMEIDEGKKDPLSLNFMLALPSFSARKLKDVQVEARGPGNENLPQKVEMKIEYYDGARLITLNKKEVPAPLHRLVDWDKVDYEYEFAGKQYRKKGTVNYSFSYDVEMNGYPDKQPLIVKLIWEDGAVEYQALLVKKNYAGPKLNPKF